MRKNTKFIKAFFKKLGAPVVLVLGLFLGFVADRVTNLFTGASHRSVSHHAVKPEAAAPVAACQNAEHHRASPLVKVAHVKHKAHHEAKAHHKHAKTHQVASAGKHKRKKSLRVASSK